MTAGLPRWWGWLLLAYPRSWRYRREQEVLDLLAESATDPLLRPGWREAAGLVAHGLGARVGMIWTPVPTTVRGRAAAISLASGSALAAAMLIRAELPALTSRYHLPTAMEHVGPFATLGALVWLTWLAALAGFVAASPTITKLALGTCVAATLTLPVWATLTGFPRPPAFLLAVQLAMATLALSGDLPANRSGQRIGIAAVGGLLLLLLVLTRPVGGPESAPVDPRADFYTVPGPGLYAIGYLTPLALMLALVALTARPRARNWVVPTAIAAVPWLYLWALTTRADLSAGYRAAGQLSVVLTVFYAGALIKHRARSQTATESSSQS